MDTNTENQEVRAKMLEEDLVTGVVLDGRYELLTPVARGGMGRVWVARAKGGRGFKRLLAVKTMLKSDYEEARLEDMLFQEAKLASMIHHPNVVAVEDFGEHRGVCYLAMELVRGETLLGLLKAASERGGLPLKMAANLIGQVCRGLQAAHDLVGEDGQSLGLVHRDVTPGNVIVTYGGVAKLLDFGIAKASTSADLTKVGELKGKMSYLAPEVLMQKPIDRRVDIFAVGVMLYLATTGTHPFRDNGGTNEILARIISEKPPISPTDLTDCYPEALEKVVMRALEKDRNKRYSSAEELLEALEEAVPEAFEPGVEREIQEYLENLFSDRISKTTAQIRAAEEMAEQSSSSVSRVQVRAEPPAPEKPVDPMKEVLRALLWVAGLIFVPMAILMGLAYKYRETEVVERTVEKTVYLPGEIKTVMVQSPPAPRPAEEPKPMPQPVAKRAAEKRTEAEPPASAPAEETKPAIPETKEVAAPSPPPTTPPAVAKSAPRTKIPFETMLDPQAPPAGPRSLSSSEGHRRLAISPTVAPYRPHIPDAIANMGPFYASAKMCVGPSGAPTSVSVTSAKTPALAPAFRSAMMKWRYRPLTEGTTPVSFCYSFQYEVL